MIDLPEKYREDEEIIRQTISQIQKDFRSASGKAPEFDFSGNKSVLFPELSKQLADVLADIYKNQKTVFQALLYRIDITETDARNTMKNSFAALADKIIQREFQKVLLRKFYSEK